MRTFDLKQGTAFREGGFRMEDYWVWGGCPIKGPDGTFHLFASRWPKRYPMHPGWLFHSEIVRAEAKELTGPYTFKEVALKRRGPSYWDGMSTHNPTIRLHQGRYYLYYVGITYADDYSSPEDLPGLYTEPYFNAWNRKRFSVAVSDSLSGPWQRTDQPLLESRPQSWDGTIISNPAICVDTDGTTYLIYKSASKTDSARGPFRLGGAVAPTPEGPFERVQDGPLFAWEDPSLFVEDPFLWKDADGFHVIMKDMSGGLSGEKHAGIHAFSEDFIHWEVETGKVAYSREVIFEDGTCQRMGSLERPQGYFEDGRLSHVFYATGDGSGGFTKAARTWNMPVRFNP